MFWIIGLSRNAKLLNIFNNTVKNHSDILSVAYSFNDIIKNEKQNKISAILTIEDGRCIDGKLENIKKYYEFKLELSKLNRAIPVIVFSIEFSVSPINYIL